MSLYPDWIIGDLSLTEYPFAVEFGSDNGAPENISELIESHLLDGEFVLSDRMSNRTLELPVLIEETDRAALAEAEALLVRECEKPINRLVIDPGDGFGPPTMFRTFRAQVEFRRSDAEEVAGVRRYLLTIPALPQAFSTTLTITPALASAATPTNAIVTDGSSTAGWSSPYGTVTTSSGVLTLPSYPAIRFYQGSTFDRHYTTAEGSLVLSPAVNFAGTRYLSAVVSIAGDAGYTGQIRTGLKVLVDDAEVTMVSHTRLSGDGTRVTFICTDTSATKITIRADLSLNTGKDEAPPPVGLRVDEITRTDAAPLTGTARQKQRVLTLPGSVRTPGTLTVSHPTSALGDVIVHTCPDFGNGYTAAVSQFSTSTGSADATTVSGRRRSTLTTMDVPTSTLAPGTYLLMARTRDGATGSQPLSYTVTTRINGTDIGPVLAGSRRIDYVKDVYNVATLGVLDLPTSRVGQNSASSQRLKITHPGRDLDEVWLFFLSDHLGNRGQITVASCGTGTPVSGGDSKMLFINSATIDEPLPGVFVGTQPDQSDSRFAAGAMWEQHEFPPNGFIVTTVTTNALDADTTLEHRAAGHSHAPL